MIKRIVGIILVVISIALLVFVIHGIASNLPADGPLKGNIRGYKPPYDGHGLVMVLSGFAAVLSFLGGLFLIGLAKLER